MAHHTLTRLLFAALAALVLGLPAASMAQGDPVHALKKALNELDASSDRSPRRRIAVQNLAEAYAEVGKPSKAKAFFVARNDDSNELQAFLTHLGHAYERNGLFKQAILAHRQVIKEDPKSFGAVFSQISIARSTAELGDDAAMAREIIRLIKLYKTFDDQTDIPEAIRNSARRNIDALALDTAEQCYKNTIKSSLEPLRYAIAILEVHTEALPDAKARRRALLLYADVLERDGGHNKLVSQLRAQAAPLPRVP